MKMKKIFPILTVFIIGALLGGLLIKYKPMPYKQVLLMLNSKLREKEKFSGTWSIGILSGKTPFDLEENLVSNPILTINNITDVEADFIADPFLVIDSISGGSDRVFYLYFEVLNRKNNQGDIGYAKSVDGINWEYKNIIIDENFHLSYPQVFVNDGEYYMIPESNEDYSIRLYKAKNFPDKWEYVGNIMSGYDFTDPTLLKANGKFWIFSSNPESNILNIYYSDSLRGKWKCHLKNPIYLKNSHYSRPGGSILSYNDKLFRFAQDDAPFYGLSLYAFEIKELTDSTYVEKLVDEQPYLTYDGEGWNSSGMHQVSLNYLNGIWYASVDGRGK